MEQAKFNGKVIDIYTITSADSPDFVLLESTLSQTSVVAFDVEWKPRLAGTSHPNFPYICLLQIACLSNTTNSNSVVFLLDLLSVDHNSISEIHKLLKGMFESDKILKLGFRFKQDFAYLSSTFQYQLPGWDSGFDRVDPLIDIFGVYIDWRSLEEKKQKRDLKKLSKICKKILDIDISLEKEEFQCSDWSIRPLTEGQKVYAANDAYMLIEIFIVYCIKVINKGGLSYDIATITMDDNLLQFVRDNGINSINLVLKESERKPKTSAVKNKGQSSAQPISKGPRPWNCSLGGDGQPKFLCDVMLVGLCKWLRVYGIDTKIADRSKYRKLSRDAWEDDMIADESEKDQRSRIKGLIKQAQKEDRVLLTRVSKTGVHDCLNYYVLKGIRKNDQLTEVVKAFELEINMDQISMCVRCNKEIERQEPLSIEEATEAVTGFSTVGWCVDCSKRYRKFLKWRLAMAWEFDLYMLEGSHTHSPSKSVRVS